MVPDNQWAAVGHLHVTHIPGVIQDAAKVQGRGLDLEIREVDFSPNGDLLFMRMLQELDLQSLLCCPDKQILLISSVKSNAELKFLPCPQPHGLQGDEEEKFNA